MPALTLKNIPEELYDQLKASAQAHHRSINSEMIHFLESSLAPRKAKPQEFLAAAQLLRQQVKGKRLSVKDIEAAKKEGRR